MLRKELSCRQKKILLQYIALLHKIQVKLYTGEQGEPGDSFRHKKEGSISPIAYEGKLKVHLMYFSILVLQSSEQSGFTKHKIVGLNNTNV